MKKEWTDLGVGATKTRTLNFFPHSFCHKSGGEIKQYRKLS